MVVQITLTDIIGFFGIIGFIATAVWILRGRFGNIEGRLGSLEVRMGSLEGRVGALEIRMGKLEEKMDEILHYIRPRKKKNRKK